MSDHGYYAILELPTIGFRKPKKQKKAALSSGNGMQEANMAQSDSFDTTVNIKRLRRTSKTSSTERGALDIRVGIVRRSTGGGNVSYSARLGFAKLGTMKLGET